MSKWLSRTATAGAARAACRMGELLKQLNNERARTDLRMGTLTQTSTASEAIALLSFPALTALIAGYLRACTDKNGRSPSRRSKSAGRA